MKLPIHKNSDRKLQMVELHLHSPMFLQSDVRLIKHKDRDTLPQQAF
jgi:hypothetical protein